MIKRITLINFMSHVHTVIEPAQGLTVLFGENNCGKSAVALAIQTVCGQHKGDFMVRHGEKECRVILETDDGHTIEWRRINKKPSYVLDGTEYYREIPDELQRLLRLPRVEIEDKQFVDIHVAEQKDPVFLLGDSGRRAAQFFANNSDAGLLMQMQGLHKKKVETAKADQRSVDASIARLERLGETLTPTEDLNKRVTAAEKALLSIEAAEKKAAGLGQMRDRLAAVGRELGQFGGSLAALKPLAGPPDLKATDGLARLIGGMTRAAHDLAATTDERQALGPLPSPPILQDTNTLAAVLADIRHAYAECDEWRLTCDRLSAVPHLPELKDTTTMEKILTAMREAERGRAEWDGELRALDKQLQSLREETSEYAAVHPTCPVCGAAMSADRILTDQEHTHV